MRLLFLIASVAFLEYVLSRHIPKKHRETGGKPFHGHGHAHTQKLPVHEHKSKQPDTTTTCPDGYCWENGRCVLKTEVPFLYECESGASELGGDCVTYIPTTKTCEPGCSIRGNHCVCTETEDPITICPAGTEVDGDECVIRYPIPETCPAGTAPAGGMCARLETVQHDCPPSFRREGMLCVSVEIADPFPSCPDQMELVEGVCRTSTTVHPTCPRGATDIGDQCATYHQPMAQCPEGYTMSRSSCKQIVFSDKVDMCPNGGMPEEGCRIVIAGPMSPHCRNIPNSILVDNACISTHQEKASYTCPDGYSLSSNTCITEIPYDCSTINYSVECVEPPVCNENDGVKDRCIPVCSAKRKNDCLPLCSGTITTDCVVRDENPNLRQLHFSHSHQQSHTHSPQLKIKRSDPAPVCQRVPLINQKTCYRNLSAQAAPFCEQGVFRGGSMCEITEYRDPDYKCDAELDEDGNCVMIQTSPTLYSCESGSTDVGTKCSRTLAAPPSEVCPHGTEEAPGCPTYAEKTCPGGDCTRVYFEDPKLNCPDGYTRQETKTQRQQKGLKSPKAYYDGDPIVRSTEKTLVECRKITYADLLTQCRGGTEPVDEFTCAEYLDPLNEEKIVQVDAQFYCDTGYSFSGRQCIREEMMDFMPQCSDNTNMIDRYHCTLISNKRERCPRGSSFEEGVCYVKQSMKALVVDTFLERGKY